MAKAIRPDKRHHEEQGRVQPMEHLEPGWAIEERDDCRVIVVPWF